MIAFDTIVLLRLLLNDDPDQARQAQELVDRAVVLDLEPGLQGVRRDETRPRHHVPVDPQVLAVPRLGLGQDLVDVHVVRGALGERAPEQPAERGGQDQGGHDHLNGLG